MVLSNPMSSLVPSFVRRTVVTVGCTHPADSDQESICFVRLGRCREQKGYPHDRKAQPSRTTAFRSTRKSAAEAEKTPASKRDVSGGSPDSGTPCRRDRCWGPGDFRRRASRPRPESGRIFATFTEDLEQMADWLLRC